MHGAKKGFESPSSTNFKLNNMEKFKKDYEKNHGYIPTDDELLSLYRSGQLLLTDKEEDMILKYFNF